MFWKLLPLIIEVVRHSADVLVERYRAMKAAEERKKSESESKKECVVDLKKQHIKRNQNDNGQRGG